MSSEGEDRPSYRHVPVSDTLDRYLDLLQERQREAIDEMGEMRDMPEDAVFDPNERRWLVPLNEGDESEEG